MGKLFSQIFEKCLFSSSGDGQVKGEGIEGMQGGEEEEEEKKERERASIGRERKGES